MALILRTGSRGEYWGDEKNSSHTLTYEQMKVNAKYIYSYLTFNGWSIEAICGLLGNMQHESALNPGRWQSEDVGNLSGGYGLVQWTPATKYIDWAESSLYLDYSTMDANLGRLMVEVANNIQYYATPDYNYSFQEFTHSKKTPYELACAFAWNYERSYVVLYGTEAEKEALRQKRGNSANEWYKFLTGVEPNKTTKKKKKKFNFILFKRRIIQ